MLYGLYIIEVSPSTKGATMKPIVLSLLNSPQRLTISTKRGKELVVDIQHISSPTGDYYTLEVRIVTAGLWPTGSGTLIFTKRDPKPTELVKLNSSESVLLIEKGYAGQLTASTGEWLKFEVKDARVEPVPDK